MMVYVRLDPEGHCVSPDGHDYIESKRLGSPIPDAIICPRCGKPWAIVVFDDQPATA